MPEPINSNFITGSSTYIMNKYRVLGKKGEGTFSEVLKCQNLKDGSFWACKKMKQHYDSVEQVNHLREIQALRRLSPHDNILELHEVMFDKKSGTLVLICELMDMNIYEMIRDRHKYLHGGKIKNYMYQLCKSIEHMHRNGIFHRDVKPENILVKDDVLKLADFGSCRSVYSKQPYTEYISTRWYRAPECLLTDGYYTYKMDMWSVGCVFFEVLSLHPLFPGSNEVDQIAKIHDIIGTPDPSVINKLRNKTRGMNFNFPPKRGSGINKLLAHTSESCIELINLMCTYDPDERISAKQALKHPYFKDLREADKKAARLKPEIAPDTEADDSKSERSMRGTNIKTNKERDNKEIKDNQEVQASQDTYKEGKEGKDTKLKMKEKEKSKDNDAASSVVIDNEKSEYKETKDSPTDPKKASTSPVRSLRPGSGTMARYPGGILHNRDPLYNYHRREKRRRRKMKVPVTSPVSQSTEGLLPKVPQAQSTTTKSMGFQPSFHFSTSTLPKIANATNANSSTTSYLPSLGQAFVKPAKQKQGSTTQASKNLFGHYQLPSIDRRGGGH